MDTQFWTEQYNKAKTALDKVLDLQLKVLEDDTREYEFDSGEGRVVGKIWGLVEVDNMVDRLTARVDNYYRKLNGGGVVMMRLRR